MLRSRKSRREEALSPEIPGPIVRADASLDPEHGALLTLLDPDVVVRADQAAVQTGAMAEIRGAMDVAKSFSGRAKFAQIALLDGDVGAVWAPGGRPRVVFGFTIEGGKIVSIDLLADPVTIGEMSVTVLSD